MLRRYFIKAIAILGTGLVNCDQAVKKHTIRRISNTRYSIPDVSTGEHFIYSKINTWLDGSPMSDQKCDGVIYRKIGDGYFKRNFSGAANVKWFGAAGNGLTDDTASIQKAIDSYPSVFFPDGEYRLTAQLNISSERSTLSGNGKESVIRTTGLIGSMFYITAHHASISNLRFTATGRVFGINVQGTGPDPVLHPSVSGCYFDTLRDSAIRVQYARNATIKDIEASNISGSTGLGVISIDYTQEASLADISITNGSVKGISALRSSHVSYTNVRVNGIATSDTLGPGFSIGLYVGYNCLHFTISGCKINGTTEACIKSSAGATNISIKNCNFQNLAGDDNGNGIMIQGSQKVVVSKCIVDTGLSRGINVQYHTRAYDVADILITGNSVKSRNSRGIYVFNAQMVSLADNTLQNTNIHVENCARNIKVTHNMITSGQYYGNSVIGIYLYRTPGATIQANIIKAGPRSAAFFSGIYATTKVDGAKILDNEIQITSTNTGSSGIMISYAENVEVLGNMVNSPIGINLNALTGSKLENNRVTSVNKGIMASASCSMLLVESNQVSAARPGDQIVSSATKSIIGNNRLRGNK